jgi:hypothetical protein
MFRSGTWPSSGVHYIINIIKIIITTIKVFNSDCASSWFFFYIYEMHGENNIKYICVWYIYFKMLFRLWRASSIISVMFIVKPLVGSTLVDIVKCLMMMLRLSDVGDNCKGNEICTKLECAVMVHSLL